jgi:aspartate/methionine/tyrosine aminotransferase
LAPYGARAREHAEGIIDLSQGTPVDATPEFIQQELKAASNSPGYPLTIGTPELRSAMRNWATEVLGASGDFDVLPTIGSKELVAWLPTILQAKTVLYPKVAYPTYLVGSMINESENIAVDIDATTWPKSNLAWINSPSNPTGRVHSESELEAVIAYARENNSVVASDECYLNFPATGQSPVSILKLAKGDNKNLLAAHSMSKRSNLAGYRAGLIVGDSEIIGKIREVRKHAGMLLPLPIQRAMTAALGDEKHVAIQAKRYAARREVLSSALIAAGFQIDFSSAGLYIWCTRNEDSWTSVSWLADLGILATPGIFYGEAGAKHIRIAMTATDDQISQAAARIMKSL